MKFSPKLVFIGLLIIGGLSLLIGRPFRPSQIPNGTVNNCANCHLNPAGGGPRNLFGQTVEQAFLDQPGAAGNVQWGPDLAHLDSDGDGFTNGQELQDPFGLWTPGQSSPGHSAFVSNPGDASSVPPTEAQFLSVNLHISSMDPHVGQMMEFGIIDVNSNTLVASQKISALSTNDTNIVFFNVLETGKMYHLDFYADFNKNGEYDPPPTDHAWRIVLENVSKDTTVNFVHNTNFTDIQGPLGTDDPISAASGYILEQNYPNPFNPLTTIAFEIPVTQFVRVDIYNTFGQKIRTLIQHQISAGRTVVQWDAIDDHGKIVPTGVYFYFLRTKNKVLVKRMTFVK
jgi:hypothetical protein